MFLIAVRGSSVTEVYG